ncbi:addiction module toxin, RelE/StbE family [Desulfofarcimen acetoxidans DSM 771]|uniref:Addiction module toxin, RelE/StbE family n=1 Tax=Desulfofarcimen acetoxidans (strain ATCC 49208 / DSM 771 / KCTC 5769 / VKM B-1644 / 5575) TaxID=485916 RepID=C8W0L2_DESAS|nr:type II toxin-antitoxin system RelE/ParE family toxin [Desulfofarcimen acetoxidans]ACV63267.1 addiction module toxin, RelE/StbE family [Desulfofarcimen acetoxidans DSM 771]
MKLVITKRAKKDLSKLDEKTNQRIIKALDKMVKCPSNADLKKLKGQEDFWRLRVGDYRVILKIVGEEITVYALRVKHRREAYDN